MSDIDLNELFKIEQINSEDYVIGDLVKKILKPHRDGVKKMSLEEVEEYLAITQEDMEKEKLNPKLIAICLETQRILKNHLDEIKKDKETKEEEIGEKF